MPWTSELAQFPTPTMATLMGLGLIHFLLQLDPS